MDTDQKFEEKPWEGPLKVETYQIIGCAFEVLNQLGHGFSEKVYENALAVELNARGIAFEKQKSFPVFYKNVQVGAFVPDLIVFNSIVVDTKVIERIGDLEKGQVLNYLRISRLTTALILNFKKASLEWDRVILTTDPFSFRETGDLKIF